MPRGSNPQTPTLTPLRRPLNLPTGGLLDPSWPDPRDRDLIRDAIEELGFDTKALISSGSTFKADKWRHELDGWTCPSTGYSLQVAKKVPWKDQENPRIEFDSLLVFANVLDEKKKPIGDINFYLTLDPRGRAEMRIGSIDIRRSIHHQKKSDEKTQRLGRGFGTNLINKLSEVCAEVGVDRISLHAVGVGSYAWAKMGFELDSRGLDCSTKEYFENFKARLIAKLDNSGYFIDEKILKSNHFRNEIESSANLKELANICPDLKLDLDNHHSNGKPAPAICDLLVRSDYNCVLEIN